MYVLDSYLPHHFISTGLRKRHKIRTGTKHRIFAMNSEQSARVDFSVGWFEWVCVRVVCSDRYLTPCDPASFWFMVDSYHMAPIRRKSELKGGYSVRSDSNVSSCYRSEKFNCSVVGSSICCMILCMSPSGPETSDSNCNKHSPPKWSPTYLSRGLWDLFFLFMLESLLFKSGA